MKENSKQNIVSKRSTVLWNEEDNFCWNVLWSLIIEEINAMWIDVLLVENIVETSIKEANDGIEKVIINYSTDSLNGNAIQFTKDSEYVDWFNDALPTITENGVLAEFIT